VFAHASPRGYRDWLRHAISTAKRRAPAQPLVFINAWNEWAEGAVLEPDTRLGHAWLHATREALQPSTVSADARPCAVLHVWYPELLDELTAALRASGIDWRVIITTAHEREAEVRHRATKLQLDAEIAAFENRGRDILPFLHVANRLLDEGVTTVLKLHTKRSTHRQDGEVWRRDLLDKLLAPQRAQRILAAMHSDPRLGLVGAEGHLQPISYYWGANRDAVAYLCTRLGIAGNDADHGLFVAGSMFWVRPEALRWLLDAHLSDDEFEAENAHSDGTLAHGIERVFALAAQAAGYRLADAAAICGIGTAQPAQAYPFARRSH
jgi:lipopolysaccharide biosynthesis protein